ncbi:MAG: hypothetical protein EKK42_07490 [Pseudonocardiaceae bacterium]|nr:MAG: hypothetical protein EKK42_07490 [Pseudonocardiaceae bacterium]
MRASHAARRPRRRRRCRARAGSAPPQLCRPRPAAAGRRRPVRSDRWRRRAGCPGPGRRGRPRSRG